MTLYVDYMAGRSRWQRGVFDEVDKHRIEEDFFITWQRYCNELRGEFGEIYGNWPFDFDHETDISLAQKDCLRIYNYLIAYNVNPQNILLFFSGNKGFHLEIDYRSYLDKPYFDLHLIYRELYKKFEKLIKPEKNKSTMDGSIYSIRRMWRYPNTRHSKTGLYCMPLTADELRLPIDQILRLAKEPRKIDIPSPVNDPIMKIAFNDAKTQYWKHVEDFEKRKTFIVEYTGEHPHCIQKMFKEGLPQGSRNNLIYLLARFLKGFKKTEEEIYKSLIDLAQKSDERDIKGVKGTIFSALKREGSFMSCESLTQWCDKKQCDLSTKKEHYMHLDRVEKVFNSCTHREAYDLLKISIANGEWKRYLKTGIGQLDRKSKVLQDSVVVIASSSDIGKSSFAITLAKNNQGKSILYLAIEEGRDRTELRLCRAEIAVCDNISIHTGKMGTITPNDIYSLAYKYSGKYDFIIIDQLVNLTELAKEERLKYKKMMEKFREIAREFKRPIFVLHQLNRLAKFDKEKEPFKEHLAEGADIERLAHDIWLLYRRKYEDNYYNFLKIDKNKNFKSPIIIPLEYDFKSNIFRDYPVELINWHIFEKELNVDQNEYFFGDVDEDLKI